MPLTPTPSQYAQPEDLVRFSLTPAVAGRFGADQQDAALLAASAIADSLIASQFVLPLATWDYSLVVAVCNIAAKLLYDQFGYNPNAVADQLVQRRYDEAIAWLQGVSRKQVTPQWVDASGDSVDSAGDFIVSDKSVGFTGCTDDDDDGCW
jgi:phage gp36-like protein